MCRAQGISESQFSRSRSENHQERQCDQCPLAFECRPRCKHASVAWWFGLTHGAGNGRTFKNERIEELGSVTTASCSGRVEPLPSPSSLVEETQPVE